MNDIDLYCVMGNPVEHSKSPWIHSRFAALTGQAINYTRRLIALDGFRQGIEAFRAEGGRGCNITVPFKFEAGSIATRMSDRATLAEAANVLSFTSAGIAADNTDGIGLVTDITVNASTPIHGRDLLLVGAGGASAGALGPLISERPHRIVVTNRTTDRALALVRRHEPWARQHGVTLAACGLSPSELLPHGSFHIVINATAASLHGTGVPIAPGVLRPGALALDMMYGAAAHGFMQWARQHGAQARDGLGMLVEQAAEAFLIWRGVRPPSALVLDELRRLTTA